MRICHLAYTFYETDSRVLRYAELMAKRGHEVEVLALRGLGQPHYDSSNGVQILRIQRRKVNEKAPIIYLGKIILFWLKCWGRLTRSQSREPFDLIHVHNMPDFLVFATHLQKTRGTRVILDIHDLVPELYAGKFHNGKEKRVVNWLKWIEKESAKFADHIIIANELWRRKLLARGIPPGKCTTILNYPDINLFCPSFRTRSDNDGRFIILYPGSLNRHQGLDIAVQAFARARDKMPGAEFHIYGEGPLKEELCRLIFELHLNGLVKLYDPIPLSQIARKIADADLGVIPKRTEGFGGEAFSTKSLEFMACEVPLIISRTPIDMEYFNDGLAHFVPSGDPDALAEAMLEAYWNRPYWQKRARRALEFARQESWQNRQKIYLDLVSSLTGKPI